MPGDFTGVLSKTKTAQYFGEVTELAEGARLEIVCGSQAHPGFESLPLRCIWKSLFENRIFGNGENKYPSALLGIINSTLPITNNQFTNNERQEGEVPELA